MVLRASLYHGPNFEVVRHCLRYRPVARQGEAVDTSACHIDFRCVVRTSKIGAACAV